MATFNEFVQIELPLRPVVVNDAAQDTLLVRKGAGPRVYEPVSINEGEVLGKKNGIIQSVSNIGQVSYTTIIPSSTIGTIAQFDYARISRKIVVELSDGTNVGTYEIMILTTSPTNSDYTLYGYMDNVQNYTLEILNNATQDLVVNNVGANDITFTVKEIT